MYYNAYTTVYNNAFINPYKIDNVTNTGYNVPTNNVNNTK